jgi:hypothetical protein
VLKRENLDKKIQQELVVAFAEVVNLGKECVNPKELWNWIQNVCKDCPPDSSEGLCINSMEMSNKDNPNQLGWIKEHHESPIARHPGRAKTLKLIKRNHQ